MNRHITACILLLAWASVVLGQVDVSNNVNADLTQNTHVVGGGSSSSYSEGGDARSKSSSGASVNYAPSSNSNYETRVQPPGFVPPYLPMWQHGGWGTVEGYFPNGPTTDDGAYERVFNPDDKDDIRMLKRLLRSAPYANGLNAIGGIFTSSLKTHRLRGFNIANAVLRDKRPKGKTIMLMIDDNIDRDLLKKAGYAYVGKISAEGDATRNWDQCYGAIIAESIPWDIDMVLISGGMKGVTVGHNIAFGGGGGYSQVNYSLSLFGSKSSGVTEGKGKPMLSAECYRYNPQLSNKRNKPREFYQMLQARYAQDTPTIQVPGINPALPASAASPGVTTMQTDVPKLNYQGGVPVNAALMEMAGIQQRHYVEYVATEPVAPPRH